MAAHPIDLATLYRRHLEHLGEAYGRAIADARLDALVIASNPIRSRSPFDDREYPFHPTPAFAHWLPLREHDAALVLVPGARPKLLRSARPSFWEGPAPIEADHFWSCFDVVEVAPDAMAAALPGGAVGFLGDVEEQATAWGVRDAARINPNKLVAALDQIRSRKTEYERACLAEANRRAIGGHERAFAAFRTGAPSELDLHLEYLAGSRQDDAEAPYKGIVALGASAGILHHIHYGRKPARPDESLLIDAGATYLGYCSDITRTAVRGAGAAAQLFGSLIAKVDAVQQEILRRIRPGLPYETLHDTAHELLAAPIRELGLIDASDDELVASGATRVFLPHGLGHSLGVQVHDVGMRLTPPRAENPFLRNTSTIAVGQVFTIEPGFYFIPSLLEKLRSGPIASKVKWSTVEALAPFGGVRIEDDIGVVDGGIRNFTRESWMDRAAAKAQSEGRAS